MKKVSKEEEGLYLLLTQLNQKNNKNLVFIVKGVTSNCTKKSSIELWHQRLGHVSHVVLSRMFDIPKQSLWQVSKCLVCLYAKQTRNQLPSSSIKSGACFDLIHVDLWVLIILLLLMITNISLRLWMIIQG